MALRIAFAVLTLLGLPTLPLAAQGDPLAVLESRYLDDWRRFKHQYVTPEGRIVDTGNGNVSHSEGQGYGMLFAVAADDRETFEQIRTWTAEVLERDDGLHFWRYDPTARPAIADPNAAADGDLLIAWALLRAGQRWDERTYLVQSRRILDALESRLVRRIGARLVIIPWDLADLDSPRVINLSYFIFPAMQDVAVATGSKLWLELYEDCLTLIEDARFGAWSLPPDWLAIDDDNRLAIWSERPPRFSYDAIRVPLHLAWAGHDTRQFLEPFVAAWQQAGAGDAPEWFELSAGGAPSRTMGPAGFRAVRAMTETAFAASALGEHRRPPMPTLYSAQDYYSASLILLSRLAEIEWWRNRLQAEQPLR